MQQALEFHAHSVSIPSQSDPRNVDFTVSDDAEADPWTTGLGFGAPRKPAPH